MATPYEEKVLTWLQTMLIDHDPQIGPGKRRIVIEEVRLEAGDSEENVSTVILFREVHRPQCLFGFRTPVREPTPSGASQWQKDLWDDPEGTGPQTDADMIVARLRESIEAADIGLPMNCDPRDITWI